jgi:hypothetical protein
MKSPDPIINEKETRRKLILGISVLSLIPLAKMGKFFSFKKEVIACAPPAESIRTVKMLTQDGKLVEVEVSNLEGADAQKISNKDLMDWVKK